ncbi:hypothetical protein HII31_02071 [Pseudocercospora fuligena]|uniref:Secreted protein n=1 Tax=Pseudocercospora fuligena TaxID=685502 RepID=A0A8H6RV00_9PEZI|nr:hypothetical protein HII31_02071 [Pseudocercospora fuligena]
MKASIFAAAASLALASAAPGSSKPSGDKNTCNGVQQLATFDDLTALPGAAELTPVPNPYKGLNFKSWDVLQAGVAGQVPAGVLPQSGTQTAVTGVTNSVLTGGPAFIPSGGYKTLDLQSLYFGCVANTVTSVAGVPQQCTIAFTAYLPGSTVAYQTINQQFDPTNAVRSNMVKATFPSTWIKMGRIDIAVVQSTTTSTLTGLLIDNVAYKVYPC